MSKATQTAEQAITALEAAGYKHFGGGRFFDPRKRGADVTLSGRFSNAEFDAMVMAEENASTKKGGPTGAFCAEIRTVLENNRKAILAGELA